ncbi:unnamed protein product [Ambrosiozyma monospora]|uniref:Unnamed protein product n=1 Tax=Ambrosiozyma monospora TaxID=43982 RepID=A0A9W7DGH9_AMBMO|nr:unnamed protein product [Ambrosiozyma monospora]
MAPIMNKNKPAFHRTKETRKRRKKGTGERRHHKPLKGKDLIKKTQEVKKEIQLQKIKLVQVKEKTKEVLTKLDSKIDEKLDLKLVRELVKVGVPANDDDEGVQRQLVKCGELFKRSNDAYSLRL